MASDAWRLAQDGRAETSAPDKRLTDEQRAKLKERVKQRTMDLAWAVTHRSVEATARAVVDRVLEGSFAAHEGMSHGHGPHGHGQGQVPVDAAEGVAHADARVPMETEAHVGQISVGQIEVGARAEVDAVKAEVGAVREELVPAAVESSSMGDAEFRARGDALLLVGRLFSGETPHETIHIYTYIHV